MGQPTSILTRPLAITGCGVLSPFGVGLEAMAAGLTLREPRRSRVTEIFPEPLPCTEACIVPDFDVSNFLGSKGTRFFDRTTGLVVVAAGLALEDSGLTVTDENRDQVGIVIGTSTGSIKSIGDFTRDTLVQERPYLVNPLLFPNTVMNCAGGQAAIWHKVKGVNTTVSGGQLSGLLALRYAAKTIRQGYAEALVVGGVEEFCPYTAWAFKHAGLLDEGDAGEGCAMFVVEDVDVARAAGRTPVAEVLACEAGVSGADAAAGLARCIERALTRAGVTAEQVWALSSSVFGQEERDAAEMAGVEMALGRVPQHHLAIKRLVGECYSASGALQLAALLALCRKHGEDAGEISIITSLGHDGSVGCAVIRGGRP